MNGIELFCGMGMSALGLQKTRDIDLVGAVDLNCGAVNAFNQQRILPPVAICGYVGDHVIDDDVDLVSGGPVCKAFSPGATLFGTKGQEDERNTFPFFLEDVEYYDPDYVLIENSYGLKRFAGYIDELIEQLEYYGYEVDAAEIDCYDYGIPATRRRMVFLGSKRGPWIIKVPKRRPAGPRTVGDCMKPPPARDPWPLLKPLSAQALDYFLRDPRHRAKHPPLTMDKRASTVVGNYAKGVPYGVVERRGRLYHCMPRLAARLQGLPDSYDLSMMRKTPALRAIGNGFPYQVVRYLLKGI
jgi:DNA (cytosine-5)-methyltransferase 1